MFAAVEHGPVLYSDSNILCLSWKGCVPKHEKDKPLCRRRYYEEGWLATGNGRGVVGVTFTSSHCKRDCITPQRINFNLRGHNSEVVLVRWNEPFQKLATCDADGGIFVWIQYEGRWSIELVNDRGTQVSDFTWSHDGTQALISYRDGFVLVGSVSGQRHWSSEINLESQLTCGIWTPDDQQVLFGTADGQVIVMDCHGRMMAHLLLHEAKGIVSMAWSYPNFIMEESSESETDSDDLSSLKLLLTVCFTSGDISLMSNYDDLTPTIIRTGLKDIVMQWCSQGDLLAVAGLEKQMVIPEYAFFTASKTAVVKFYNHHGEHIYLLETPAQRPISTLCWGHKDSRLFLACGAALYVIRVERRLASLQLLCQQVIASTVREEKDVSKLSIPSRLSRYVSSAFAPTIKPPIPDTSNMRDFVSYPSSGNERLYCTMKRTDDNLDVGGPCYTLYLEYLGGLVPILKGCRISKLRPEFIIMDPKTDGKTDDLYGNSLITSVVDSCNCSDCSDIELSDDWIGKKSPKMSRGSKSPKLPRINIDPRKSPKLSRATQEVSRSPRLPIRKPIGSIGSPSPSRREFPLEDLTQNNYLAQVTSNIWGTKFKIVGLASFLPTNLGTVIYKTSLLHLQPRQMTIYLPEVKKISMEYINLPIFSPNVFSEDDDDLPATTNPGVPDDTPPCTVNIPIAPIHSPAQTMSRTQSIGLVQSLMASKDIFSSEKKTSPTKGPVHSKDTALMTHYTVPSRCSNSDQVIFGGINVGQVLDTQLLSSELCQHEMHLKQHQQQLPQFQELQQQQHCQEMHHLQQQQYQLQVQQKQQIQQQQMLQNRLLQQQQHHLRLQVQKMEQQHLPQLNQMQQQPLQMHRQVNHQHQQQRQMQIPAHSLPSGSPFRQFLQLSQSNAHASQHTGNYEAKQMENELLLNIKPIPPTFYLAEGDAVVFSAPQEINKITAPPPYRGTVYTPVAAAAAAMMPLSAANGSSSSVGAGSNSGTPHQEDTYQKRDDDNLQQSATQTAPYSTSFGFERITTFDSSGNVEEICQPRMQLISNQNLSTVPCSGSSAMLRVSSSSSEEKKVQLSYASSKLNQLTVPRYSISSGYEPPYTDAASEISSAQSCRQTLDTRMIHGTLSLEDSQEVILKGSQMLYPQRTLPTKTSTLSVSYQQTAPVTLHTCSQCSSISGASREVTTSDNCDIASDTVKRKDFSPSASGTTHNTVIVHSSSNLVLPSESSYNLIHVRGIYNVIGGSDNRDTSDFINTAFTVNEPLNQSLRQLSLNKEGVKPTVKQPQSYQWDQSVTDEIWVPQDQATSFSITPHTVSHKPPALILNPAQPVDVSHFPDISSSSSTHPSATKFKASETYQITIPCSPGSSDVGAHLQPVLDSPLPFLPKQMVAPVALSQQDHTLVLPPIYPPNLSSFTCCSPPPNLGVSSGPNLPMTPVAVCPWDTCNPCPAMPSFLSALPENVSQIMEKNVLSLPSQTAQLLLPFTDTEGLVNSPEDTSETAESFQEVLSLSKGIIPQYADKFGKKNRKRLDSNRNDEVSVPAITVCNKSRKEGRALIDFSISSPGLGGQDKKTKGQKEQQKTKRFSKPTTGDFQDSSESESEFIVIGDELMNQNQSTKKGWKAKKSLRSGGCELDDIKFLRKAVEKEECGLDNQGFVYIMANKQPLWNEATQVYQLDFGGRVTQESAKNFQIELEGRQVMQFGRIDGNAYILDFQYPFSAVQAFAVALANVTQRLK
uniref:SOCS box domain-containing protein n=1 Tax=Electrophorus electricus TaxID=8005 RepID=A0A4W4EPF3_ELEEL